MSLSRLTPSPLEGGSRLVCFHHVGGDRNTFQLVSKHFVGNKKCEVFSVAYPGRSKTDAPPLTRLEDIVELVYGSMMAMGGDDFWGARPLSFFGHSLGGMVAFELARRLQVRNPAIKLSQLIVSAVKSPRSLTQTNVAMAAAKTAHHSKGDDDLLRHIKAIGGLPAGLSDSFVKVKLSMIRSDFEAFEQYRFDDNILPPRLACSLTAFSGTKDAVVAEADMLSWMLHTQAEYRHVAFQNGSHFYFGEEAGRREFLDELLRCVA